MKGTMKSTMNVEKIEARSPRPLTGRMVLFCLLAFFGVVFAVNGVMIEAALSTFSGLETESAYQAGRKFEQEVALAKEQDGQRWRVNAKLAATADGSERVDIEARDAAGHLLTGLEAAAVFERPTDRRIGPRCRHLAGFSGPISWQRHCGGGPMGPRYRPDAARRPSVPVEKSRHFAVSADYG